MLTSDLMFWVLVLTVAAMVANVVMMIANRHRPMPPIDLAPAVPKVLLLERHERLLDSAMKARDAARTGDAFSAFVLLDAALRTDEAMVAARAAGDVS